MCFKALELIGKTKKTTVEEVHESISKLPGGDKLVNGVTLEDLALFLDNSIEMPAIAAIVGGLLANEVIKSISPCIPKSPCAIFSVSMFSPVKGPSRNSVEITYTCTI